MDLSLMRMAIDVAANSECYAGQVGSILIMPKHPGIIIPSWNRPPPGQPTCRAMHQCLLRHDGIKNRCVRTVHAEIVGLQMAVSQGLDPFGGTIYLSKLPCHSCAKVLSQFGIVEVNYVNSNTTLPVIGFDTVPGIRFIQITTEEICGLLPTPTTP